VPVSAYPVVPFGVGQPHRSLRITCATRYRPTSAPTFHLQDVTHYGIRLDTRHLAEPGQLCRQRLKLRLFPLVQRAAQARRILDRLLGISMWDKERPRSSVFLIFCRLSSLNPMR
jgi:hypothetical protein